MNEILNETRRATADTAVALAHAFNQDPAHWLHLAGYLEYDPTSGYSPEAADLARRVDALPYGQRRQQILDLLATALTMLAGEEGEPN